LYILFFFFFSSRRRHTSFSRDWSSDVCSSDLSVAAGSDVLFLHGNLSFGSSSGAARNSARAFLLWLFLTLLLLDPFQQLKCVVQIGRACVGKECEWRWDRDRCTK